MRRLFSPAACMRSSCLSLPWCLQRRAFCISPSHSLTHAPAPCQERDPASTRGWKVLSSVGHGPRERGWPDESTHVCCRSEGNDTPGQTSLSAIYRARGAQWSPEGFLTPARHDLTGEACRHLPAVAMAAAEQLSKTSKGWRLGKGA